MSNLSEAAKTLRTSDDPQEKSQAASVLGHAGGKAKGGESDISDKGGNQGGNQGSNQGGTDLSEAAKKMRTADDPQERSQAASVMGHAGGQARKDNQ